MLRDLRDYLGEQEPTVLVVYAFSGFVVMAGTLVMALLRLGVFELNFGPAD